MPDQPIIFEPRIDHASPHLQRLVRLIFSDEFSPGSRLVERNLSKSLGVSRVPVREGLQKLASKGLILKDGPHGGLRLRDYTPKEVSNLHEYREAIELAATRSAAQNRTKTDLVQLEVICDEMEAEAVHAPSARWLGLDWQFHQTLVGASTNERFIDAFDLLMIEYNYVFFRLPARLSPNRNKENPEHASHIKDVINAHRQVIALLKARDTEAVVAAMRLHLAGLSEKVHREVVKTQLMKEEAELA